jgi:hypothetical protein
MHCLVIDHGIYSSLQAAQDAASPGDRLLVRGTCVGTTEIRTDNLTISGQNKTSLDGGRAGTVLRIDGGVIVTIRRLTITGGSTSGSGGGIVNDGTLSLYDSSISGNHANVQGGGAHNSPGGTVNLYGSNISGNSGDIQGGGVSNYGTLNLYGSSSIGDNSAYFGGGVINLGPNALLTLNDDSRISDNSGGSYGGGVYSNGALNLNDHSSITGNSGGSGGGVYTAGTLTLNDNSSISGNSASNRGGGVYNHGTRNGAVAPPMPCPMDVSGYNVYCNTPDNIYP